MKSLRRHITAIVSFWTIAASIAVIVMFLFYAYTLKYKEHEKNVEVSINILKNFIEEDISSAPAVADWIVEAFKVGREVSKLWFSWYVITRNDIVVFSTNPRIPVGGSFSPIVSWSEDIGTATVSVFGKDQFLVVIRKGVYLIYMAMDFSKYTEVISEKPAKIFIVSPKGEIMAGDRDMIGYSIASLGLDFEILESEDENEEIRTANMDVIALKEKHGFYVVSMYDRLIVMKSIFRDMVPYVMLFGIVAFFGVDFLMRVVTKGIMDPVESMVEDIEKGNLPIETEYEEFNRISDALEELIIRLKSIYQGLRFTASLEFEVDFDDPQIELSMMKKFELSLPMIFKSYRAVAYYSVGDGFLRLESTGGHSEEIMDLLEKFGGEEIEREKIESLFNENPLTAVWVEFPEVEGVLLVVPVYIEKILRYIVAVRLRNISGRTEVEAGEILVLEYNLILEQINTMRKLNTLATTDFLTGLKNRMYFMNRLEEECERMKRYGMGPKSFGVSMLDLDGLKKVNDTYGHEVGDEYIKTFADYIKSVIRKSDVAGRLGGDEFGIIWMNVNEEELKVIERRIINGLKNLYTPKTGIKVSASVGSAIYGKDGTTPDELLNIADMRMYTMKTMRKVNRR